MATKTTFKDRRLRMCAAADDAESIASDLRKFADILVDSARFLQREAQSMERAEARFAQRQETQKAAPEGRPLPTS